MMNILDSIKNVCKKNILLPLVTSCLCIVILAVCPFLNIFHPDSTNDIFHLNYSDSCVHVTVDTLYYSGYDLIKSGNTHYAYYYALKDRQCRFVIVPFEGTPETTLTNYTFTGRIIKPDKSFQEMLQSFAKDLNWNTQDLSAISGGLVISNADYHPVRYMILFWIVLMILFLSLKKLITNGIFFMNPYMYPVCTFLGKKEQKELIDDAQEELDCNNYLQINSMYITENYFIDFGKKKISIIPFNDMVWCYRIGSISFNPRRHIAKYALHFTIISGSVITVRNKSSDEALEAINAIRATEYPIIVGHSESKRKMARKRVSQYKKQKENLES